jgi:cysteine desulfurase/selenocysteine lyase
MPKNPSISQARKDFPILKRKIKGYSLAYLDNAATTQKPKSVIDAITNFYENHNSNVSRGVYTLAEEATEIYESGREAVANFIGTEESESIIFTSGTTESINLVASAWGQKNLKKGDRIILTEMEHHSNIVPWQLAAQSYGVELVYWPITPEGRLNLLELEALLTNSVKLLAFTMVSNVLGSINPVKKITEIAHSHGVPVLVDSAQAASRMFIKVSEWDCDFLAFSGHKVYGPTGIGVLYAKKERMEEMIPFKGGGGMIRNVEKQSSSWALPPHKFEAGTPPVAQVSGLKAALEYLEKYGINEIERHDNELTKHAINQLTEFPDLELYGPNEIKNRTGVISFNLQNVHPHDVAQVLDESGIALRAGHHCTKVLHKRLGVPATVRMSFGIYNNYSEIDRMLSTLDQAREIFLH